MTLAPARACASTTSGLRPPTSLFRTKLPTRIGLFISWLISRVSGPVPKRLDFMTTAFIPASLAWCASVRRSIRRSPSTIFGAPCTWRSMASIINCSIDISYSFLYKNRYPRAKLAGIDVNLCFLQHTWTSSICPKTLVKIIF